MGGVGQFDVQSQAGLEDLGGRVVRSVVEAESLRLASFEQGDTKGMHPMFAVLS